MQRHISIFGCEWYMVTFHLPFAAAVVDNSARPIAKTAANDGPARFSSMEIVCCVVIRDAHSHRAQLMMSALMRSH